MSTSALDAAMKHARSFRSELALRRVGSSMDLGELRSRLGGPIPDDPSDPVAVIERLAAASDGLVGSDGPRYFGFVVGGSTTAALAADHLVTAWDQNAGGYALSPLAAVAEEVAGRWLLDLLGLSSPCSVGFTTGGTMANVICLAAGRSAVLADRGWDVERNGLFGAPPIQVLVGEQRHVSVDLALRYLGLGSGRVHTVPADDQGRIRPDALSAELERCAGPTILVLQAGNVNSGAIDPIAEAVAVGRERGTWVHVDGAFGLWAAASPRLRDLLRGIESCDSWATDGHKWLNVPYDSGLAIVADSAAHHRAMNVADADYLVTGDGARDNADWVTEMSRRARGIPVWAAICELGRSGVAAMVDRCCALARRFADELAAAEDVQVLNEVVLNQVLVRFRSDDEDHDARTRAIIAAVQDDGTAWLAGTRWQGAAAMRISVSNWSTTEDDVDRTVQAILRAAAAH